MNEEYSKVTLSELTNRVYEKCDYKQKIVKDVIDTFVDELQDAIINNHQVQIKNCCTFRHRWRNEKKSGNFGNPGIIPAHMAVITTISRNVTKKMNKLYKNGSMTKPNSLHDLPLDDFK